MADPVVTLEYQPDPVISPSFWTSLNPDLRNQPAIEVAYGIFGSGPLDRIASTGSMTFGLRNRADGLLLQGRWTPGHANCNTGWTVGAPIRLTLEYGAFQHIKFRGRLTSIVPKLGTNREQIVSCTVLDWMDDAALTKIDSIPMQADKRADELITTVVAAAPLQPYSTSYATGSDVYPLGIDRPQTIYSELSRIVMSEFGYLYIKGTNGGVGGKLTFENRGTRLALTTSNFTFTVSHINDAALAVTRDAIVNVADVVTHPRTVDALPTTVLFTNDAPIFVAAGATVNVNARFTDATQRAIRVSGVNMVAPVSGTDYIAFANSDATGSNLTANFTVTADYTGDGAYYTIVNAGADGYVTTLQARGRGVYDFQPVSSRSTDTFSVGAYGERRLPIDLPYQDDANVGFAVAAFVTTTWAAPNGEFGITFFARNATLLAQAIAREPGDRITVVEASAGISADYFINGVRLRIEPGKLVTASFTLAKADVETYWILGLAGYSELDATTRLAPL